MLDSAIDYPVGSMSEDFDWQADQGAGWERGVQETIPKAAGSRKRYWYSILVSLLALVAGGALASWLLSQHMNKLYTTVKLDILATHNLILHADQQRDVSLLTGVLSHESSNWVKSQKELAQEGLLFGRTSFGLYLPPGSEHTSDLADQYLNAPEDFKEITMSPNLTTATVTSDILYLIDYGNQVTDTVTLRRTEFYSHVGNRWLLAPPEKGFWGQWMTIREGRLSLRFPERDKKIAERLAVDLDAILDHMCKSLADVDCPDNLHASIILDSDSGSLVATSDPAIMLNGMSPIRLPAPTLVGTPVDDAGHQALLHGYASHIVAAMISQIVGWQCCEKGLFYQALLDKQLSQLNIRPWPLTQAEYQVMFRYPIIDIAKLQPVWSKAPLSLSSQATWRQIYSMVDFILESNPNISPAIIQRRLISSNDYRSWLAKNGFDTIGSALQNRWLQFVQTKIEKEHLPLPLPDQDIFLLCSSDYSDVGALYRYDLANGQIVPELTDRALQFMIPLPGDDGLLLQERPLQFSPPEVFMWQGGCELEVASQMTDALLFPIDSSNPNRLLFHSYEADRDGALYSQLNVEACTTGRCAIQPLQGFPVWTPDGRSTIIATDEGLLRMGDAQGQQLSAIGQGSYPFWIDDNTYGYVDNQPQPAIVIASTLDHHARALIPLETLTAAVSFNLPVEQLSIHSISVKQDEPNKLFVALNIADSTQHVQDRALIISYDLATGQANLLLRLERALTAYQPLRFSPGGRWLAVQSLDRTRTCWQLHLLNLHSNQTETFTSVYRFAYPDYDWSANGRWLLRIDRELLYLIAPDPDYQQVIFHGFPNCFFAAWVKDKVNCE